MKRDSAKLFFVLAKTAKNVENEPGGLQKIWFFAGKGRTLPVCL